MNTNSIPEFVDVGNGNIKIVLSNFTGELIARDIVALTRYMGCPIPKQPTSEPNGTRGPPIGVASEARSSRKNVEEEKERNHVPSQPVEEGIDHPADQEDNTSVNLLEDSTTGDDDSSTVPELKETAEGLNVSVAYDDDIEYEPELSQQVSYWKY